MPETGTRKSRFLTKQMRLQKLLADHPDCYFCGGANPSTTCDHVPPQACFPKGYFPEGFEFAACEACNKGASKHDLIFGLYTFLMDFDPTKMEGKEDRKRLKELKRGVENNYPEALPASGERTPVFRTGSIFSPVPVAIQLPTTPVMEEALIATVSKLTHALYLREVGTILTSRHSFCGYAFQPQVRGTEDLMAFLCSLLPKMVIGERLNVKKYGDRFRYSSGYKAEEDFFVHASQFGHGVILWGIVCGPNGECPEGPFFKWRQAACGPCAESTEQTA